MLGPRKLTFISVLNKLFVFNITPFSIIYTRKFILFYLFLYFSVKKMWFTLKTSLLSLTKLTLKRKWVFTCELIFQQYALLVTAEFSRHYSTVVCRKTHFIYFFFFFLQKYIYKTELLEDLSTISRNGTKGNQCRILPF